MTKCFLEEEKPPRPSLRTGARPGQSPDKSECSIVTTRASKHMIFEQNLHVTQNALGLGQSLLPCAVPPFMFKSSRTWL